MNRFAAGVGETVIAMIGIFLLITAWSHFSKPATPYDSWSMEDAKTKKRIIQNPGEVTLDKWDMQPGLVWNRAAINVTNGFSFPVGKIVVKAQFLDKSGAVTGDREASSGELKAGEKWKVSFFMIPKDNSIKVSDVFVYEP